LTFQFFSVYLYSLGANRNRLVSTDLRGHNGAELTSEKLVQTIKWRCFRTYGDNRTLEVWCRGCSL